MEDAVDLVTGLTARPEYQPTGESLTVLHDLALGSQVEAALMHDPNVWVENLRVTARGGELTLSGQVLAEEDRDAAEAAAIRDVFPNGVPDEGNPNREKILEQIGKSVSECATVAHGLGVQLRMEEHGNGTSNIPTVRKILDYADNPNVYVIWNCSPSDTGTNLRCKSTSCPSAVSEFSKSSGSAGRELVSNSDAEAGSKTGTFTTCGSASPGRLTDRLTLVTGTYRGPVSESDGEGGFPCTASSVSRFSGAWAAGNFAGSLLAGELHFQ